MADEVPGINLKVLSPSAEVEGGVTFADLPTSTTIKELRSRIQDAVPSRPATERMRLIYRGRVVANDASTLGEVFGVDSIRESNDQSLHLVLRELPPSGSMSSSPAPRSSTAPPNPFRPPPPTQPASPALQTNPFRTLPQPRPSSQPQVPHHHHHPHLPVTPEMLHAQALAQQQMAQRTLNRPFPPSAAGTQPANAAQGAPTGLPPLPGFGPPHLPQDGRTVRQEGVGPNGERWSVTTYSSSAIPIGAPPQQPHMHPPLFPPPPAFGPPPLVGIPRQPTPSGNRDHMLQQVRTALDRARSEMGNVRTLLQTPELQNVQANLPGISNPPAWRLERTRQHVGEMERNLETIERGVSLLAVASPNTPELIALRESATDLRTQLNELTRSMPPQVNAPAHVQHSTIQLPASNAQADTAPQTLPPGLPEELFLLSSPQGPVGVLFNQQGTFMTAPMASSLPFQTFTDQFARNRQILSSLGQHIVHGAQLQGQIANIQANMAATQQATNASQAQQQPQGQLPGQPQQQVQPQNANQNENQNANPPGDEDRIGNIAGHLWLLFKLGCFVYFFSGGGGWYKSIALGVIAGGVYLAQLGIFDEQFNMIRRHLEAVLPVGALAERVVQGRNPNPPAQRTEPGRTPTPEEAARRLLQQQRNERFGWARETMRSVERAFAIFIASLWPGIGERMVHAQEERVRADRAAEEERQRQVEEAQRQEAEAQQQNEEARDDTKVQGGQMDTAPSSKGKKKADVTQDEATSSNQVTE